MAANPPTPAPATTAAGRANTRPRKASTAGATGTPGPDGAAAGAAAGPSTSSAIGGPAVSMAPPSLAGSGGPTTKEDCEHIAAQLLDTGHTNKRRLELACELRDTAESNRDFTFYNVYLSVFVPALVTILGDEKTIAFGRDSFDHRFRHTLLSFLNRLPHTEPFRAYEATVMDLMIKLIKAENEENALICIKITIDGFRAHREQAQPFVEPFLNLVKAMYANTKTVVEKEFGDKTSLKPPVRFPKPAVQLVEALLADDLEKASATGPAHSPNPPTPATPASDGSAAPPPPPTPSSSAPSPYARALHSPKVLTECPIAVVLIFQTWKDIMDGTMLDFYPLVMDSIKIQPEPQRKAHEEAKERGEVFVGVAAGISNREMYTELIKAQVKTMAFLAYVLRGGKLDDNIKPYLPLFPEACVRLLKDCPPEDVATRKELLVATRHILTADSRSSFVPYIDILLEEKVLVGNGITCRESMRPLAYSVVADLIHHVRNELDLAQLNKVTLVFSSNLNDPTFNSSIQTMCAKLLNTVIESIQSKEDKAEAARLMQTMFVTCIEKMAAFVDTYDRIKAVQTRDKGKGKAKEVEAAPATDEDVNMEEEAAPATDGDEPFSDLQLYGWRDIERAMPVNSVAYANETLEVFGRDGRYLYKTLLHLFRTLLSHTKGDDTQLRAPDGEQLSTFFQHCLRAFTIFEGLRDPREPKEAIELVSQIFFAIEPHEFSEFWANNMDFFVELSAVNIHVFPVIQMLITNSEVSHQLVGILLKYLMNHLGEIGHHDKSRANLFLRLFKMSYLAINSFIDRNESVLVPHLQKLIMSSFTYAAKAPDPTVYYHILRALFRSIGGGRFEALYKEVLPILQDMLDTLAYLLRHATDSAQKDLFTELTLTVPVRLTNLLPHLSYLMAPLVHALRAGPELVSQGLRTLELCIDNLTADFLDPNLGPVLRQLMAGLHQLLKPVPAHRTHAHAAAKIIGKLGGRNRRFIEVEYQLDYQTPQSELAVNVTFESKTKPLQLDPLVDAAVAVLKDDKVAYIEDALPMLCSTALSMLAEGAPTPEGNLVFQKAMGGLFIACQREDVGERANEFVRSFCKRAFAAELGRDESLNFISSKFSPVTIRKGFAHLPLTIAIGNCMVYTLLEARQPEVAGLQKLITTVVADLQELAASPPYANTPDETNRSVDRMISAFSHRFLHMCHEEDWNRKMAGVAAIRGLLVDGNPQRRWIIDLEVDIVRALLYCLRDAPKESPQSADDIIDLVKHLIRTCQSQEDGRVQKQQRLMDTLVTELNSQSKLARDSAHEFLACLAEVNERELSELVGPTAKARLLDGSPGPVFNKPIRALPFPLQVGVIDAVTWLMELQPPVVEFNDEFTRLFHEVLALADVEDHNLIGKPASLKNEQWLKTLRVSCIRLLRSTMATPEFAETPNLAQLRPRVIQVYFKHVYSPDAGIVKVSFDGLRDVLQNQSKLPKEVLQTGLRPILVNLADAKRLSVPGLDGLAKFLELLNNYFKVEIGIKLLDHFASLGDEQTLEKASQSPLEDNPDITRMARLVNIFRLLPPSASQFLVRLVGHVVEAEARLHQTSPGPFTEVLAKYLDRYYDEACTNLLDNIRNPRYIWTYRNIISSGHAPRLVEALSNRAEDLAQACFAESDQTELVMPGLLLVRELTRVDPKWVNDRTETMLQPIVNVWRAILVKSRETKEDMSDTQYQQMPAIILELFMTYLKQQQHIPLLSHVVEAFEIRSSFERSSVTFFLYQQVALQESVQYRRELLEYFLNLYQHDDVSWAFKTNMLRLVINPTLRLYFEDKDNDGSLISPFFIQKVNDTMWKPLAVPAAAKEKEDSLLIEVFSLTTMLIQHVHSKVDQSRKEVFKFAWMGINLLEPTVKLTAYVLTATFMATYETPSKFIKLCWIGLLRLKENETRTLYREALRILASTLPKIDPPGPTAIPEWAQRVKSILIEEGQTTNQLVTVCELIVNHPDLFYEYRELYIPHIANSLQKLAFHASANYELKKLSVDAVELIFRWERRRIATRDAEAMDVDGASGTRKRPGSDSNDHPGKKQKIDGTGTAVSASSGGGWAVPGQVRELMTAHLLRLVSSSTDPVAKGGLTKRALDLFKEILGPRGLPNVHVKLNFFQRTMTQEIKDDTFNVVANSAEVIAAIAASKDQNWIRANMTTLSKLLEKIWTSEDSILHDIVEPLTDSLFKELPDEDAMETEGTGEGRYLIKFVRDAVMDGLQSGLRSNSAMPGTLFLLRHWLKAQPGQLQTETISSGLLRVLANLVRLHTGNAGNPNQPDPMYRFIISILDIFRDRVGDLREHRRHFHVTLSGLIERTTNVTLCRYLLDLLRHWVIDDPEPTSQGKEKAQLLKIMSVFEQRGDDELFEKYLDLIYDIYEIKELQGTDITHRLEPCFLLGARSKQPKQRARFLDKLEQSLPVSLDGRLQYLYSLQNWDCIADGYWVPQILSMLLAVAEEQEPLFQRPLASLYEDDRIQSLAQEATIGDIIRPARNLIHTDEELAHKLWVAVFPHCWAALGRQQQSAFTPYIVKLLSKDYHRKQVEMRPNVIQTFLAGILPCNPPVTLPPLLIKYLAKTYNAWYTGFEILHKLFEVYKADDGLRESCSTALIELYSDLCEDDMYYGLVRTRCAFPETVAALSYEQNGVWPKAMEMYEQAQVKARNGMLPFSEEEYCLWEDHWVLSAQKLQLWDGLTELARQDNDSDLLLEAAWRLSDWGSTDRESIETSLNRVIDVPTPRRKTYEAFIALLRAHTVREVPNDFVRLLDEAQQVSLQKWITLPSNHLTAAHIPLLQMFQQCVELTEAATVFDSLQMTNSNNLEMRANNDLKSTFTTWRDRLPNFWDDISVWSDLLAWRQHVFTAVTKVYVPLIPNNEGSTYGYRGYHEQAWMINRFGEVARRHGLLDVCSIALNKIYSLPNIEISEAFLKLREQALCFFQKPDKFHEGLDNISTTNLMYFTAGQKAEFLTLKGMFISRLGQMEEANSEFAHAIQMDMNLPKAWAEWGRFNDKLYRERPEAVPPMPEPETGQPRYTEELWAAKYSRDRAVLASSAVSCYLQAAGLYNNHKARGLLLRVLWLLGLDDSQFTIAKGFDNYKGDLVIWYWITLIPQLLLSLSHREAKQARTILLRMAKMYPQALFYNLRVIREEWGGNKRQIMQSRAAAAARKAAEAQAQAARSATPNTAPTPTHAASSTGDEHAASSSQAAAASSNGDGDVEMKEAKDEPSAAPAPAPAQNGTPAPNGTPVSAPAPAPAAPAGPRPPLDYVDELINVLKTAFPLLALSMEKMVDHITIRAKPNSEEDIYRFFAALLNDAMQQWCGRHIIPNDDGDLNAQTKDNLFKFANNLSGELRGAIQKDFMEDMPKLRDYITRLQYWRDVYERVLDERVKVQSLDQNGCNLNEFHHNKFDEVDVPGQYLQHIDPSEELVKIGRFSPTVELGRGHGHCFRRITMVGSNGSSHTFVIQMPAARHCRREDRLTAFFRIMNSVLAKRKESRRRNLQFHVPTAVAFAHQLRLVQSDSTHVSLQDILDDHNRRKNMSREDGTMMFYDRLKQLHDPSLAPTDNRFIQLKVEIMEEIQTKMIPENILTNYMIRTMKTPESLWLMRKQFATQAAANMFLTYMCCLHGRSPTRFQLSRKTGNMYMTEILPATSSSNPIISSTESVPFRLTPNMQHFITRTGVEGIVSAVLTALSKSLTLPEFDLSGTLTIFLRDEVVFWQSAYKQDPRPDVPNATLVYTNADKFIRRAQLIGFLGEDKDSKSGNPGGVLHSAVTLISAATSPHNLAQMTESYQAWF